MSASASVEIDLEDGLIPGSDLPRRVFLHFHNREILGLYGADRCSERDTYRHTLLLTRYALIVSERALLILPKYFFECPYFQSYWNAISPIRSAGLVEFANEHPDFLPDVEAKRKQFRGTPMLFPDYFDRGKARHHLQELRGIPWVRRIGESATDAIAARWTAELETDHGLLQNIVRETPVSDMPRIERRLHDVPNRLAGHAFIQRNVEQVLGSPLTPRQKVVVNTLINDAYLGPFLRLLDVSIICDTPLGALDCGLRADARLAGRMVSFNSLRGWLEMFGVRKSIEHMSWSELVLIRQAPVFRWLLNQILSASRDIRPLQFAIVESSCESLCSKGRSMAPMGTKTLIDYLYRVYEKLGGSLDGGVVTGFERVQLSNAAWEKEAASRLRAKEPVVNDQIEMGFNAIRSCESSNAESLDRKTTLRHRTFVQTPYDKLQLVTNDYDAQERQFQHGLLRFVDYRHFDSGASPNEGIDAALESERRSVLKQLMECDQAVPSFSIVIPVRGSQVALAECVKSLARQSFVLRRPDCVEVLIVQDGSDQESVALQLRPLFKVLGCRTRLITLKTQQGRSTARNVGIYHAVNEILLFVDASMVLHADFIAEHALRHSRAKSIALLGFKENIALAAYQDLRPALWDGRAAPHYTADWKWSHVLQEEEAGFSFRGRRYLAGDNIGYMDLTNSLRGLPATEQVGYRSLPTFFQTNLVSVSKHEFCSIGGFDNRFDAMWGFEDSFAGALLCANGTMMVPCPSSVAFKIEHAGVRTKAFELLRHRQQFYELLSKQQAGVYCERRLHERIGALEKRGEIVEEMIVV